MAGEVSIGAPALGALVGVGVLGPLTVTTPAGPFVPRGRLRPMLAWLALVGPGGTTLERLAELVWAGAGPLRPPRELAKLLSQLRRSLGSSAVVVSESRVGLAPGMVDVDAERFTALLCGDATGTAPGPAGGSRGEALRAGLGLWRGSPYPEIAEHPDAMEEIRRLERLWAFATAELALMRLADSEPPCDVVADLYPALNEGIDGDTLGAVVAVGLALAARRVEALRALGDLEPTDPRQRAWRDATEQAIRLDDGAALTRQVQELHATISGAWAPLAASERRWGLRA